jgi:hypothetical protein
VGALGYSVACSVGVTESLVDDWGVGGLVLRESGVETGGVYLAYCVANFLLGWHFVTHFVL